ncbi:DUF4174 domain-containing protein [Neiella marina]|uniref:DUF4174 domain-containing protein n=1 Tax=Neiella holothuriorum TaxID=2870530 RepID=A0ABS7EL75_9GAMM|nr:DUF4174 domain-containing protein [Neiella holothuriorum]MBW8192638.1 DUF4174 domain-containing protein [Neiella holothuriorum]
MIRILALCALLVNSNADAKLVSLEQLQWQNRIILVQCDSVQCQHASTQQLEQAELAVQDRHIVWFVTTSEHISTNALAPLSEQLQTVLRSNTLARPQTLLIGKDGAIKRRDKVLQLQVLLKQIDRMPMRQAEIAWHSI